MTYVLFDFVILYLKSDLFFIFMEIKCNVPSKLLKKVICPLIHYEFILIQMNCVTLL